MALARPGQIPVARHRLTPLPTPGQAFASTLQDRKDRMARLRIRLLGPFQVTLNGDSVARFETRKAQALLAYLAAEADRAHRRELLGEMLWPERPQGASRANLRHTLSSLRRAIGDRSPSGKRSRSSKLEADAPFLLATRETIQFNRAAEVWVDSMAFLELLEGPTPTDRLPITQLEEAVNLYRGPFLEDISIDDSTLFHEWLLLEREKYRRQVAEALSGLAVCYEIQRMFDRGLEYARRRLELEPWDEQGHRQVMRLLALAGQRGAALAQYEACCQLLSAELAVAPEPETTELLERIRDDRLEIPTPVREPTLALATPGFLREDAERARPPLFVARERELARLGAFLEETLSGQGRVVFVSGGPGQGKTALLAEFARRALDDHPHLAVAQGNCSAYAGVGDPYLPFREVLAMLTGEIEARWAAGSLSREQARRLWDALPLALEVLLTHGTSLIGTLLHGEALLSRAATVLPQRLDLLERLQALTLRARDRPIELEQSFLFEQLTHMLHTLAAEHPLLLLLDDMQWVDSASAGLLFHLGRRLAGRRLLIVCAYRPEEIAPDRNGERHPLAKALGEFRRTFGDVWLDLSRADAAEGHRFVDALLDSEPNRLGEGFREDLFRRTAGQPLFTIELLRAMAERGDLVRHAADGAWIQGRALDWAMLPARVEAVIEGRVSRLDPELTEILSVASVEGEVFTAQVVASVRGIEEVPLLRRLTRELEARHHLVREQGEVQAGPRHLDRYRFSHILVQNHIYQRLGRGERRALHGEVAAALEGLYEEQQDEIAVQLAHHFDRAGNLGRAFHYSTLAAEKAARAYANDEAITHYTRAIDLAEAASADAVGLARLYRGRGLACEKLGQFERARADHESILQVARAARDRPLEWRALIDLGKLWTSRDYEQARARFEQALELARRADDPALLAESLNWMGNWYLNAEDPQAAVAHHEEALKVFEQSGDQRGLATTLDLLGIAGLLGGNITAMVWYYDRAIALLRELGDLPSLASSLTGRGHAGGTGYAMLTAVSPTVPTAPRQDFEEAARIARDIGSAYGEAWVLWSKGLLCMVQGGFGQALEAAHSSLEIATQIAHREGRAASCCVLGMLYAELEAPEEARRHLDVALTLAEELRSRVLTHWAAGALAGAYCLLGDLPGAQACLDTVLSSEASLDSLYVRYCWARRAELALRQGNPALALEIVKRLIAATPGVSPGRVITFLWKLKGEALAALDDTEAACSLLQAAIGNARSTRERFLLWRLHASLGQLYWAVDRQPEAEVEFSSARQLVKELADTIPGGELKDNFLRQAGNRLSPWP
jgi:DNA-binding SARP family transcriptional activator